MNLPELRLRLSYRTGRDDLVKDFFNPCLESSVLYRRAAGYFTSSGLALAARGVASLAARRGKMQLVVSPYLEPDDVEALRAASETPLDALRAIAARSLADIEDALIKDRLNALAWLAASGLLEIKLALRLDSQGGYARGIFHEKAGVFTDAHDNHIAFSGSSNETAGGLLENFESIKVFCSWKDTEGRVQEEVAWCSKRREHHHRTLSRVPGTASASRAATAPRRDSPAAGPSARQRARTASPVYPLQSTSAERDPPSIAGGT